MMAKPLQHSCLENSMNSMKRQKDMTLKDELLSSVGARKPGMLQSMEAQRVGHDWGTEQQQQSNYEPTPLLKATKSEKWNTWNISY